MADFQLLSCGTICVLTAESEAAQQWTTEHLPDDRQLWGRNGTVIEPRYVAPILEGIINDDLTVTMEQEYT